MTLAEIYFVSQILAVVPVIAGHDTYFYSDFRH